MLDKKQYVEALTSLKKVEALVNEGGGSTAGTAVYRARIEQQRKRAKAGPQLVVARKLILDKKYKDAVTVLKTLRSMYPGVEEIEKLLRSTQKRLE